MDQSRRRFFSSLAVLPAAIAITAPTAASAVEIEGCPRDPMEYVKALLAATRDKLKSQYDLTN